MSRRVDSAQAISPAVLLATIVVLLIAMLGVFRLALGPGRTTREKDHAPVTHSTTHLPTGASAWSATSHTPRRR